ncbi:MAG: hypothetical protein LH480_10695 [Rubrivivax sp.]|nr:hypothetical protein [Rubrivivax sp.]
MQRRTLLSVGVATGALLAVAGGTLALIRPGRRADVLTAPARAMFAAVARAVLGQQLPVEQSAQTRALEAHLSRVQAIIAGLPPAMQAEVDELITVVASAPGRIALVGLTRDWSTATVSEVGQALQNMRQSSLSVRQQAYHALRNMSNAAYFADAATWPAIGYPGPRSL